MIFTLLRLLKLVYLYCNHYDNTNSNKYMECAKNTTKEIEY